MKRFAILLLALALTACGEPEVNAPTDPAAPIPTPEEPGTVTIPGRTPTLPGRGPTSFVGRWAAQPGWCGNTTGPEQAIEISTTRFEGYENGCDITEIGEVQGGYIVSLACEAEGVSAAERVRLSVAGQTLSLTWLDRASLKTEFTRCPALDPPHTESPVGGQPVS
ncbi:MAG: hypothetical protein V4707_03670 [Pseudomonadota bacterium]